uniref:PCI domain-containing protein n=1 Tax=Chlamydomonas euryale TaxID=1486919 RepID=A0A7R9V4F1_9CHLO|mmetsp:Transcript_17860/g.53551  ORF Transcript_17860/g.53551 Transcript_17860/m.53551 type:complete len:498 (+) Transcript_17860:192-1685(+)
MAAGDAMVTDDDKAVASQPGSTEEKKEEKKLTVQESLRAIVSLIETCVKTKDTRLLAGRLLRSTATIRAQLKSQVLAEFVKTYLVGADASSSRQFLLSTLEQGADNMAVEDAPAPSSAVPAPMPTTCLPETEMYAHLLVLGRLVSQKKWEQAKEVADRAAARLAAFNRRTLDTIAARILYYYSLAYENLGSLSAIRSTLLAMHCTAVLRHDTAGQEVLMNLLLRNYLHYNLYDQAEKFRSKAQKSDAFRSNQQFCRYLYYVGRIRTIQLEYTDAKDFLQQAARKAPSTALGFRVAASKWLILVRLLLGEVPDLQEFALPVLGSSLKPYLDLTTAVRSGDLVSFAEVAKQHETVFRADGTGNLITRLHHNVIRTGLRRINMAYSRISLQDIAAKLHLSSVDDTECIVAKAIRDGGIDAVIDHEGGFMASKEVADVYSTGEPQAAFHARIAFCLDLHNEAVKSMRYEPDAHKRMQAATQRDRMTPEELAKAIAEEDDEF